MAVFDFSSFFGFFTILPFLFIISFLISISSSFVFSFIADFDLSLFFCQLLCHFPLLLFEDISQCGLFLLCFLFSLWIFVKCKVHFPRFLVLSPLKLRVSFLVFGGFKKGFGSECLGGCRFFEFYA